MMRTPGSKIRFFRRHTESLMQSELETTGKPSWGVPTASIPDSDDTVGEQSILAEELTALGTHTQQLNSKHMPLIRGSQHNKGADSDLRAAIDRHFTIRSL